MNIMNYSFKSSFPISRNADVKIENLNVNINKHGKSHHTRSHTLCLVSPSWDAWILRPCFIKDQSQCVLSTLTFTPALRGSFKVSHSRQNHAASTDSRSAWQILRSFHTSEVTETEIGIWKLWERGERIDMVLWSSLRSMIMYCMFEPCQHLSWSERYYTIFYLRHPYLAEVMLLCFLWVSTTV